MPESTNSAQITLLRTILQAVEKYSDELQGGKTRQDAFAGEKQYLPVEPSISKQKSSGKRDSVSTHLIEYLNEDDNVNSLIKLLANQRQKDELANSWETLSQFDEYQRNGEDIIDYVSKFDKKYQKVVRRGITLSPEVLALKILSRARLSKHERLIIIKSIDFTKKEKLYVEAKGALEKLGEYQKRRRRFRESRRGKRLEQNEEAGKYCLVLDSACSSSLCGKKWLDSYLEYLGEGIDELEHIPSEKSFIFGGGEPVKSIACCRIPAILAGKVVTMEVDVVPNDLPLIYSLSDMKKSEIKLDFTNDTAEIFGQVIHLKITESGHYCVPIDGMTFRKR